MSGIRFNGGAHAPWDRNTFISGSIVAVIVSRGGVVAKSSVVPTGIAPAVTSGTEDFTNPFEAVLATVANTMGNIVNAKVTVKGEDGKDKKEPANYNRRTVVFYIGHSGTVQSLQRLYNATEGLSKEEVQSDDFFEKFIADKKGNVPSESEMKSWAQIIALLPNFTDLRFKRSISEELRDRVEARIERKKQAARSRQDNWQMAVCKAHRLAWDATPEVDHGEQGELGQLSEAAI